MGIRYFDCFYSCGILQQCFYLAVLQNHFLHSSYCPLMVMLCQLSAVAQLCEQLLHHEVAADDERMKVDCLRVLKITLCYYSHSDCCYLQTVRIANPTCLPTEAPDLRVEQFQQCDLQIEQIAGCVVSCFSTAYPCCFFSEDFTYCCFHHCLLHYSLQQYVTSSIVCFLSFYLFAPLASFLHQIL